MFTPRIFQVVFSLLDEFDVCRAELWKRSWHLLTVNIYGQITNDDWPSNTVQTNVRHPGKPRRATYPAPILTETSRAKRALRAELGVELRALLRAPRLLRLCLLRQKVHQPNLMVTICYNMLQFMLRLMLWLNFGFLRCFKGTQLMTMFHDRENKHIARCWGLWIPSCSQNPNHLSPDLKKEAQKHVQMSCTIICRAIN